MQLSVVVPVYNEETLVLALCERLDAALATLAGRHQLPTSECEVIFVDDGSRDRTRELLEQVCSTRPGRRLVVLSRNHGHQLAITAGLDHARGAAVVLIDGDLQDPPEFIVDLYARLQDGFDVVYAVRESRAGESGFKRATAALFYRLLRWLTDVDIPADTGDFRIMSRRVVNELQGMRERHRFLRGLVSWVGFRQTGLPYRRDQRSSGTTKFPLRRMLRFAIDGITSFSALPLRLISLLGFGSALVGFGYAAYAIYARLFTQQTITGWTSTIVLVLVLGGVQLLALGMIGEYLARVHDEVKQRPLYVVDRVVAAEVVADAGSEAAASARSRGQQ